MITTMIMCRIQIMKSDMIIIEAGDITKSDCEAIVNAANQRMLGGGGVDGAIHRAAGPELYEHCRQIEEVNGVRCPIGSSVITPSFNLCSKWIIHTVGPYWSGGERNEANLLASCYRTSCNLAVDYGLKSIAFPAISCGAYSYPIAEACSIAVETVKEFPDLVVKFIAFEQDVYNELVRLN